MATDKPHIKTQLRREMLKTLTLTEDPELRTRIQQQLYDLLGVNKASKVIAAKGVKGAKPAELPPPASGDNLLGITQ